VTRSLEVELEDRHLINHILSLYRSSSKLFLICYIPSSTLFKVVTIIKYRLKGKLMLMKESSKLSDQAVSNRLTKTLFSRAFDQALFPFTPLLNFVILILNALIQYLHSSVLLRICDLVKTIARNQIFSFKHEMLSIFTIL